jgi:hypothetical protein
VAVISVMSAKGAPGTTTTTLLLATLWPAPSIVLDADPLGGDIALRMLRSDGRAMDPDRGLLSLLPAARRGLLPETVAQHTQEAVGGQPVLAGLPGPEQALAVAPLWPQLSEVFAKVPGADMFIDVGQVQARSEHLPLIQHSDLLLCVYRPRAWSALHTRRRIEAIGETPRDFGVRVGIVGVAGPDQEADRLMAASAIGTGLDWVTDYGAIAFDPRAVVMFEGVVVYRPERTLLARSGRTVAERLYTDLSLVAASRSDDAADHEGPDGDHAAAAVLPGADDEPLRRGRRRAKKRSREVKGAR